MWPVLLEIPLFGGIRIYTYGVLVALGFFAGVGWTVREGRKDQLSRDLILDLSFYIVLAALIGSRILYILTNLDQYVENPLDVLKVWKGGLVFFGGLLGALAVSFYYAKKMKIPFLKLADAFMPGIALGHAIGRLGCFASGCCHGRPWAGFFSTTFPDLPMTLAPAGIPLFPSQLMESFTALLIFLLLCFLRKRQKFIGQIFFAYLVVYSMSRILLEYFRSDLARSYLIPHWFSVSQAISLCLVLFGLLAFIRRAKGARP
ncbi:MAG: prolipoprotein diacylglyceryl transferase [Deltaproteobacteria bacterium]|nr:prolipoprotein diacylglyceryl transferase [Deltaproteobacteria bacterium]